MRETIDLTGSWLCLPDPFGEGRVGEYFSPTHNTARWRESEVPTSFERALPALIGYQGAVWYRREVNISEQWRDRYVSIQFEGASYHTTVWINGVEIGRNDGGFLPFAFPLGEHVKWGGDNAVVVRVDNIRHAHELPGNQRGWRPHGGILREMRLVAMTPCHIEALHLDALLKNGAGELRAVVRLEGDLDAYRDLRLSLTVAPGDIAFETLFGSGQKEILVEGQVPGVIPWSPANPHLYDVVLRLSSGDILLDTVKVRTGFRSITTSGNQLLLNGEPIFLAGFNRHEDSPRTDFSPDDELTRSDLQTMKDMGCNYVRLAHYPHHPRELDMCDELGLLVMAEIPLYWWQGHRDGEEVHQQKFEGARRQLQRMIERDNHHPAIVMWAVSNETSEEYPEVANGNRELVEFCKELDPTRLAMHVSSRWTTHPHFEADDVVCLNGYPTCEYLYGDKQDEFGADGQAWWKHHLAKLHALYPDKPVLITEFGYPALDGVLAGGAGEDAQAKALEQESAAFDAPSICGVTVWCYADHPWPEGLFVNGVTTSPYGVVSRDRRKKRAFEVVARLFQKRLLPKGD